MCKESYECTFTMSKLGINGHKSGIDTLLYSYTLLVLKKMALTFVCMIVVFYMQLKFSD